MKLNLSKIALAIAVALSSASASAEFLDFQVAEGSVPGANASAITADKLNGGFTEYLTFTGPNSFSAQAYANIGQFFSNEGTVLVPSQLSCNPTFFPACYNMYALFSATGTFSGLDFTGGTGAFRLFIDPEQNTTLSGSSGLVPITTGNTADDYEIAFSNVLESGSGTLSSAPGAYNFFFTGFTLTTGDQNLTTPGTQNGSLYFVSPDPFYFRVQVNGDNDRFTPVGPNTIQVTGDVSAVFVPEPGTLALTGLALGLLGFASRRRRT